MERVKRGGETHRDTFFSLSIQDKQLVSCLRHIALWSNRLYTIRHLIIIFTMWVCLLSVFVLGVVVVVVCFPYTGMRAKVHIMMNVTITVYRALGRPPNRATENKLAQTQTTKAFI